MRCEKCGIDLSPRVWRIHAKQCNGHNETLDDIDIRKIAKENGIKSWHVKSLETLKKELDDF